MTYDGDIINFIKKDKFGWRLTTVIYYVIKIIPQINGPR